MVVVVVVVSVVVVAVVQVLALVLTVDFVAALLAVFVLPSAAVGRPESVVLVTKIPGRFDSRGEPCDYEHFSF